MVQKRVEQTIEQLKASDPRSSVWVGASAGTGKTFVLTTRVLRLMLSGSKPEKILCLTYTKTAATEMAIRVNDRLASWIGLGDEELLNELTDLLGHAPSDDQTVLARKLFALVLDMPGGIKIQTIHSFCQSLLGRFPIEAKVTPQFSLLDDITINDLLRVSRDELLEDIHNGKSKELTEALKYISQMIAENTFIDLMKSLAHERGGLEYLLQINSRSLDQVFSSLKVILGFLKTDNRQSIISIASDENNFEAAGLREAVTALLTGTKTDIKKGDIIAKWLENGKENFQEYKRAFLTTDGVFFKSYMTKKLGENHPDALDVLYKEAERVKFVDQRLKAYTLYENCVAILRLGYSLIKTYNKRKVSHNVVDYDDLIFKVRALFDQPNIASWILYKLDDGLDHILIDEAQDTNPDQWHVVRTLATEFFTGLGTRDEEECQDHPRTIFAVGDIKQSIFSFQKAKPENFELNRQYFEKQAADASLKFSTVPMNLSFRSTAAVLDVVDEVFKPDDRRVAISFSAEEISHATHRTGAAGLVEVWPTTLPEEKEQDESWPAPIIQVPEHDPKRKVAERIADQIKSWIDNGEVLKSKGRPITAGDILIIVQKRKDFVHYMIRELKKRNIDVAGLDRMRLTEQLAVMDLIAVANFTLLPSDDLNLAVVLKSPLLGFDDDDLYELAANRGKRKSLWSVLLKRRHESEKFEAAATYLTTITNYSDYKPPFEFFSYLLGPLRGREKIVARLGEQANEPVDEFLNQAMTFEQNNISSMQAFLSWIERGEIEIKRDMEQSGDKVRIMTTHGAKGLQAPIVFLPDTCQAPTLQDDLFWYDNKQEHDLSLLWVKNKDSRVGAGKIAYENRKKAAEDENKRLLYVAMTRAEDRLYVTGWEQNKSRNPECWYDMIKNALSEMDKVEELTDQDGEIILRREEGEPASEKSSDEADEIKTAIPLPTWATMAPQAEPTPTRPLTPSKPDEEEEAVTSPLKVVEQMKRDKRKYHRGRLIHKLLEILPEIAVENREGALGRYLTQDAHELNEGDIAQISEEVQGILNNPELEGLFGPGSRSEVPIVGQIGDFSLSGEVDRLAVTDDEVIIVDYKTNRPPPESVEKIPRIYQRQMAAYRAVLSQIYPDHKVKSYLLWTDVGNMMEIPDNLLDKVIF